MSEAEVFDAIAGLKDERKQEDGPTFIVFVWCRGDVRGFVIGSVERAEST